MASSRSLANRFALRLWCWVAVGRRFGSSGGHLIELAALAGLLAAMVSLVLPVWLAFVLTPDAPPVNRLLEACQQGIRRGPLVFVGYGAVALLTGWAAFVVVRLSSRGARDLALIRSQGRLLNALNEVELCAGGQAVAVRLLATEHALAFSAGLVRPRIYLSTTLLRRVSAAELEATLLHELTHVRMRDPLRCWLVELVVWSLWFPRTSWLGTAHRAAREAHADAGVLEAMEDDRPLLRALTKVDALASVPGACGLTAERERALRQLRHHGHRVGRTERSALVLGLSLVLAMMFVAVAGLSDWQSYWFCPDTMGMPV